MKEYNFITPVSMVCSLEQYNKDLKKGLEKLGYVPKYLEVFIDDNVVIGTNYQNAPNVFSTIGYEYRNENNRYFIEEYNPGLFLALAAMKSPDEIVVPGEIVVGKAAYSDLYKDELMYVKYIDEGYAYHIGLGCENPFPDVNFNSHKIGIEYRKATKEEIIEFYTGYKEFVDFRKGTERLLGYKGESRCYVLSGPSDSTKKVEKIIEEINPDEFENYYPEGWVTTDINDLLIYHRKFDIDVYELMIRCHKKGILINVIGDSLD